MNNRILVVIVSVVVGIIMLGGVLIPVIHDAQTTFNETTYQNATYDEHAKYYDDELVLVLDASSASTVGETIITANGEPVSMRDSWNRHVILDSENLILEINTNSSGVLAYVRYTDVDGVTVYSSSYHVGGVLTIHWMPDADIIMMQYNEETPIYINSTYCFALSTDAVYGYLNTNAGFSTAYISDSVISNNTGGVITVFSATLPTSEGDINCTIITDIAGTRCVWDRTAYTKEITAELTFRGLSLVDGTTDVYTGGIPVFIVSYDEGETIEEFPARSWILNEIPGHVVSTSESELLSAVPLMVIIALLVLAMGIVTLRGRN